MSDEINNERVNIGSFFFFIDHSIENQADICGCDVSIYKEKIKLHNQ